MRFGEREGTTLILLEDQAKAAGLAGTFRCRMITLDIHSSLEAAKVGNTEKMSGFHNAAYGPVAFGTSARSPVLTDWPGGGFIGIHGTDAPRLIPGHISHGCIRLRNSAILHLARIMGVGTPLSVR